VLSARDEAARGEQERLQASVAGEQDRRRELQKSALGGIVMATTFSSPRRSAGFAIALLVMILGLPRLALAQGSAPLVSANSPIGLNHPTGWGAIQQTAIDTNGDWLVEEFPDGGLFEFPANGGSMITLVPLAGLGSNNGYQNPSVLLDPNNNLYVGGNWNNCLLVFPYDPTTNTWDTLNVLTASNNSSAECGVAPYSLAQYSIFGFSPYYFQPWGVAIGNNNNIIVGSQNSGNFIFSMAVQGAWSNPSVTQSSTSTFEIISSMTKRPNSIAVDPQGDVFFVEDSGGLPGVYEITAAQVAAGQANSADVLTTDAGLARVDPNLPNVTGVITDPSGNLYISDGSDGVFVVPNSSGTVETSSAYQVSAVPAQGEVAIDWARDIMYVPTSQKQNNGQADVAKVDLGYAELGSSTVLTATANSIPVMYTFNGSATPASFVIVEDGVSKPDFALTSGTCTMGTAYTAGNSCTESVSMTPHSVGSISAKLLMLDSKSNVLASIVLHGTGTGALMQASPALESNIGASGSLSTPSQVAVDGQGNVYVADAGKGAVLMYAAGSSAAAKSIGTGLTAPTGVAVDGAGDVFIADSGNVYEIPFGSSGLNVSGQAKLTSSLGSNLRLAADGLGNLYVADPSKARVVKLSNLGQTGPTLVAQSETMMTAGFTAPSAVAVDSTNNLYVIDGSNLLEVAGGLGAPNTLLSTLNGASGVAVDASGAVYISSSGGTERIPLVSGALATGSATVVAASVSNPTSVALDQSSNVYLTDGAGEDVHVVSVNGSLTFAPFTAANQSAALNATVTNTGNAALTVTGYSATNPVVDSVPVTDFTATDGTCVADSPIAVGATCQVAVTLNPGPGEQGALSSQITLPGTSVNVPVINATGTGFTLAGSKLNVSVAGSAQAINAPVTVNVSPQSGGTMPTGQVALTFTSWQAKLLACPNPPTNCGPVPVPVTETVTGTLNGSGISSFNLSPIMAGTQTITIEYIGDRTFGRSTSTVNATIAKSQITSLALDPNPPTYLPFVLEQDGSTPYDGSQSYWQYNLPVTINTAAGVPTGNITFMDNSSTCPPGTSATGQGAAICALANYSGPACPQSTSSSLLSGNGIQFIVNSGTNSTSAAAQFSTSCLQMLQNTTYTPVISTHYITPVYSGDANFQGFTGSAPQLFQVLRSPLVTIASNPSTLTVPSGSSASTTLTLTSLLGYGYAGKGGQLNNYNFPVTLSCDNLPPHSECSFTYPSTVNPNQPTAPNSVQIPCSGTTAAADNCLPGTVTMTINTNISVGTTSSRNAAVASVTLASIFGLGMLSLFFRRRTFAKAGWLPMIVLMIVGCGLAISLSACSTTNLTPQAQLSSPSGTYAVTVTAQQVGSIVLNEPGVGEVDVYGSENQVSLPFYVNVTVQ
jgi:sugar lactone lactonase YvrE